MLKKYLVFSIDDGTIYDKDVISLFNKYGIRGTFNINSNLANYTWYYNDSVPITRLDFMSNYELYKNHEVASHTLDHIHLTSVDRKEIIRQVNGDLTYLKWLFKRNEISSFAMPFSDNNEWVNNIIKEHTNVSNIRVSEIDESFNPPSDRYFIKITSLDINRALELFPKFLKSRKKISVFIYAGHSYDFYLNNTFTKLEEFLKLIKAHKEIEVITMKELVNTIFKK